MTSLKSKNWSLMLRKVFKISELTMYDVITAPTGNHPKQFQVWTSHKENIYIFLAFKFYGESKTFLRHSKLFLCFLLCSVSYHLSFEYIFFGDLWRYEIVFQTSVQLFLLFMRIISCCFWRKKRKCAREKAACVGIFLFWRFIFLF